MAERHHSKIEKAVIAATTLFAIGNVAACAPTEAAPAPPAAASEIPSSPSPQESEIVETPQEIPEIDLMDVATYKVRREPLMDSETSWSYLRTKLDELGSTPQIAPIAYEYTDLLESTQSGDTEALNELDYYCQLNKNLTIAANILAANREYLDNSFILSGSLQDVVIDLGGADNIKTDSLVQLFLEAIDKVPEGAVISDFVIMRVEYGNGTVFNVRYVDESGNEGTGSYHHSAVPIPAIDMNASTFSGGYEFYDSSTNFGDSIEIGFPHYAS